MHNSRSAEPVIEISNLETRLGGQLIHQGVNLQVRAGEVLGIVGGSGSGKSVLLRQIVMLLEPSAGSIKLFGEEVTGALSTDQRDRLRRRFGMMFQQGALFSSMTVLENIMAPLREHTAIPAEWQRELALMKLALAGLPTHAAHKYPRELSGGMLKRAAVARALALDPELLILDEPSAGLDPNSANALDELILQLKESLGLTVVMVSHDLDSLWKVTDRVAFLGRKQVLALDSMSALSRSQEPLIQEYFSGPRGRIAKEFA